MERTQIIEQYLDGMLGDEEKRLLEERAAFDKDLREQIMLHKEINESIRDKDLSELQGIIERISAEHIVSDNSFKQSGIMPVEKGWMFHLIRIAAILLIVAGAGVILRYAFFSDTNAQKLYNRYYSLYDADGISRSARSDQLILDDAIMDFTQKNFTESLNKLNSIIVSDKHNYMAWFFRGLTCLETEATAEAILSFKAIPASWDSPYREHRDWYMALAYLRNNNVSAAMEEFTHIADAKGYYAVRAEKILQKLRP
jgi:hypothetical protein